MSRKPPQDVQRPMFCHAALQKDVGRERSKQAVFASLPHTRQRSLYDTRGEQFVCYQFVPVESLLRDGGLTSLIFLIPALSNSCPRAGNRSNCPDGPYREQENRSTPY